MGYASYLEDIRERLHEDLVEPAEELLADPAFARFLESKTRLHAFVRTARQLMESIKAHIELATDPEVDLAAEVVSLGKRVVELEKLRDKLFSAFREADTELQKLRPDVSRRAMVEKLQEHEQRRAVDKRERKSALLAKQIIEGENAYLKEKCARMKEELTALRPHKGAQAKLAECQLENSRLRQELSVQKRELQETKNALRDVLRWEKDVDSLDE